jgi:hypothetical protein
LFEFLVVPKNNKKHWTDNFGYTMVEFMYQEVMREIRVAMEATHYVAFNYDEVFTVDNQSWLFIHCYVIHN